jgi:hypothetical protein
MASKMEKKKTFCFKTSEAHGQGINESFLKLVKDKE